MHRLAAVGWTLILFGTSALADVGPVGQWDLSAQFGGQTNESTLTVTKTGDNLTAKMKGQRGERDLDNVTFADGTLKFDMTFDRQGQQMTLQFAGKIVGDKLDGNWSSDFGDFPVAGKRAGGKNPLVGTWKLMVDSPLGNNPRELEIKPDLTGTYGGGEDFPVFPLEHVKVDGDSAKIDVILKSDQGELDCTLDLKFAGDKLTGTLDYGSGEATIVGERAKNPIIGTWKLLVDSQLGENERVLVIKSDMTGTYGGGDFPEFKVANVHVDNGSATMDVTLEFQGQEIPATIKLSLADGKVSGVLDYGQGEATIKGERE